MHGHIPDAARDVAVLLFLRLFFAESAKVDATKGLRVFEAELGIKVVGGLRSATLEFSSRIVLGAAAIRDNFDVVIARQQILASVAKHSVASELKRLQKL